MQRQSLLLGKSSYKPAKNLEVNLQTDNLAERLKAGQNISAHLPSASIETLEEIAQILRNRILEVVSKNGGHLSSTLGAVDLILAMHAVYDCSKHPFIYDVSHQAYAHKLLTGRFKEFETLRKFEGLSGFIAPSESPLDYFIAGHSSTSLSLAVGVAKARRLAGQTNQESSKPIALIGDGSMSAGLVYEALNELGDLKLPVVILLNDNEMSIARPIGVMSKILSRTIASPLYQFMRERVKKVVDHLPNGAAFIAKRFEESLKLITPGLLFEEFGIDYIGPIDGHNLAELTSVLKSTKNLNRPVLIHCQTIKGKGYKIAEGRYEKWHGVSPFNLDTGQALANSKSQSPTAVFSKTLLSMARENPRIVGVTAAMPSGTGLDKLMDEFPDRFFDVAIAEQHAVTSMAALAKEGYRPYVAIYSTFLQRAFDQIVHDVSIMNLPVVFCIDRAGIVGEDGETHQDLLDLAYLQSLPNMTLTAPRDNQSLEIALRWSVATKGPLACRYPRGKFVAEEFFGTGDTGDLSSFENLDSKKRGILATSVIAKALKDGLEGYEACLRQGKAQDLLTNWQATLEATHPAAPVEVNASNQSVLLLGYGNGVGRAAATLRALYADYGVMANLADLVFLKPIDFEFVKDCISRYSHIFVFSDSYRLGGVASRLMQVAQEVYLDSLSKQDASIKLPIIFSLEIEDKFIKHGKTEAVEESLGLDSLSLARKVYDLLKNTGYKGASPIHSKGENA